jgi:hypothetical protein
MNSQVDALLAHPAKTYRITPFKAPDLDTCWSACNGVEGFGHVDEDPELRKTRRRLGEFRTRLPGAPRVILYRPDKADPLMLQLWMLREVSADLAEATLLISSLARALHVWDRPFAGLDVSVIDWGPLETDRFELSIAVVGRASSYCRLKEAYESLMRTFDAGAWA